MPITQFSVEVTQYFPLFSEVHLKIIILKGKRLFFPKRVPPHSAFFLFKFYWRIEIYNVMIVSGVQQSDSVTHTHTHTHTSIPAFFISPKDTIDLSRLPSSSMPLPQACQLYLLSSIVLIILWSPSLLTLFIFIKSQLESCNSSLRSF